VGSYSDPALILPGAVGQTELSADSKKNVASGVAGLNASGKLPFASLHEPENQGFTNLIENGDFEVWSGGAAAAPDGWNFAEDGSGGSVERVADTKIKTYATRITKSNSGHTHMYQIKSDYLRFQSRTITIGGWVKSANTVSDEVKIMIGDGVGYGYGYYQNSGDWEWVTATLAIDASATHIFAYNSVFTDADATADYVGIIMVEGSVCPPFSPKPLSINDKDIASGIAGLDADSALSPTQMSKIGLDPVLVTDFTAGTDVYHGHDAEQSTSSTSYTLIKTITLDWLPSSELRIAFDLKMGGQDITSINGKIYRNGSPIGTERATNNRLQFTTYIENLSGWSVGDTLELYLHAHFVSKPAICKNFRILCTAAGLSDS